MTIMSLFGELNTAQKIAASIPKQHALVLAGAGCGKTKTIIARAAFLIHAGVPPSKINILTFTRRSAFEIVERVKMHLGDQARGIQASTFHSWCMRLIRKAPKLFGCSDYSVIDRDDQLQLFKVLRGKNSETSLPTASQLCDIYSFSRNTSQSLGVALEKNFPEHVDSYEKIAKIMIAYEARKRERKYIDYDDVLEVVAVRLNNDPNVLSWVTSQVSFLLVDEMQDTNPLQWRIMDPLKKDVKLFCVGDDAQSIYGFRGADFRNVHSFSERVPDAKILRLEENYRSTQEILDLSNWLLEGSPLQYGKKLHAVRGHGQKPQLHNFPNEWEEAGWIASDLALRRSQGAPWNNHMILVRSSSAGRIVESALLAREIPYRYIGGSKLFESAHVRDVLSVLRIIANPQDEIAWMRYLMLWGGIGEISASKIVNKLLDASSFEEVLHILKEDKKTSGELCSAIEQAANAGSSVAVTLRVVVKCLMGLLSERYKNQDWDKRKRDYMLVERLAERHSSILEFIEEYTLEPVSGTQVERSSIDDVVTVITIHSAKGAESEVCYVINVSPGAFPSSYAQGSLDDVEEERRVLYVALTRAKNELVLTRHGYSFYSEEGADKSVETYFLNRDYTGLVDVVDHFRPLERNQQKENRIGLPEGVGIKL